MKYKIINPGKAPNRFGRRRDIYDSAENLLYTGEVNGNGRPHGKGERYYTDGPFKGLVEFKGEFKNGGIKNGTRKFYYWDPNFPTNHDNRRPKADLVYENGRSTGKGKGYPSCTSVWKWHKGAITEDGEITGKGKTFYKSGNVLYKGNFVKGRYEDKDGKKFRDRKDGRLWYEGGFQYGVYFGKGTSYARNGHVRHKGVYGSNKYYGEGIRYYVKGTHIGKIEYKGIFRGQFDSGKRYEYHPNGNKSKVEAGVFALNGHVRKGKWKFYGADGKIKAKVKIEDDDTVGEWTLYKPGKKVWYVGEIDNDINPHGEGTVYYVDRPGVVKVEDAIYHHGKLIKGTKVDYHINGEYKYKVWIDRNASEETTGMLYNSHREKRYYGPITEEGMPQGRGKIYLDNGDWLLGEVNDYKFLKKSENSVRIFHYIDYNWVEQRLSNERSPERLPNEKRKRGDDDSLSNKEHLNKKQKTE